MHGLFDFPRPLILKLQQQVLKFNHICVSWNSPKTDLMTSLENLKNNSENREREFFSIATFK